MNRNALPPGVVHQKLDRAKERLERIDHEVAGLRATKRLLEGAAGVPSADGPGVPGNVTAADVLGRGRGFREGWERAVGSTAGAPAPADPGDAFTVSPGAPIEAEMIGDISRLRSLDRRIAEATGTEGALAARRVVVNAPDGSTLSADEDFVASRLDPAKPLHAAAIAKLGLSLPEKIPAPMLGAGPDAAATIVAALGKITAAEARRTADGLRAQAFNLQTRSVSIQLADPAGVVVFESEITKELAGEVAALLDQVRDPDPLASAALLKPITEPMMVAVNAGGGLAVGHPAVLTPEMIAAGVAATGAPERGPLGMATVSFTENALPREFSSYGRLVTSALHPVATHAEQPFPGSKARVTELPNDRSIWDPAERDLLARFLAWAAKPFMIRRPGHSVAHKLLEQVPLTQFVYSKDVGGMVAKTDFEGSLPVILVEHDWGRLFADATKVGSSADEWRPPYDLQVFEFNISGAAVVVNVAVRECESGYVNSTMCVSVRPEGTPHWVNDRCAVELRPDGWSPLVGADLIARGDPLVNANFARLYDFIFAQIKGCSIMLDAEVAVTEATRAPYKTNEPAKDRKPLPKLSHHIVRLNRRPRFEAAEGGSGVERNRPRMHLRRGHWRHLPKYKIWIKWMVVGSADLGWVDKTYRQ